MYSCARLSLLFLGFLLVSLYQQGDSSLLGHVDLSKPTPVWNILNICPTSLTNNKTTGKKLISVLGKGIGLSFTVQIGPSEIALDQPHIVNVQGDEVSVFQFIPHQDISDKQLDITATSQSTVAAYLKVSQNCKEVDVQKDLESINYKKESLRLSFATKGRITLSSVSIPPLTDSVSRWFIGIGLKNSAGDIKLSESKNVTLKLTRSFGYNYTTPICVLLFLSFLVGIGVTIFAYFLFKEPLAQVMPDNQVNNNAHLVFRMWEVIRYSCFSFDPKSYPHITFIVGATLTVVAFLFVFLNWDTMIQEGNRDKCYYNDFCYRVVSYDIPFNLMISNLTYIVHGLILVLSVLILETKVILQNFHGYSFSIAYALAWALVFQGLLSTLYHLCPAVFTFQFDIAFMFIMAGLIVVLLHNGIRQNHFPNGRHPVDASNFFLFFVMPLFVLNFFIALPYLNSGLYAFLIIWWLSMVVWAFYKLRRGQKFRGDNGDYNLSLFVLGGLFMPIVIFMLVFLFGDLALALLYACITCSVVAVLAKVGRNWVTLLNIFLTFVIWVAAVVVFILQPTTDKTLSPENSRGKNEECVILGFFDWHDLWHFLSSFAFLMNVFVVMFISFKP